jgi:hypothetical protein
MYTAIHSSLRWFAAVLLVVVAAVHVPMVPDHLQEAPYIGALFIALSVVSVSLAAVIAIWDSPAVWTATGLVTLLALVGFLLSRTIGLPELGDDIGNWTEPLGFPAMAAETLATAVAATVLRYRPTTHHPRRGAS